MAPRYARARRREKSQLLDEFCAITGYTRKHALVLLSDPPSEDRARQVGGRPRSYGPAEVALLRMCWSATDGICSKRLAPFLPELLERARSSASVVTDVPGSSLISLNGEAIQQQVHVRFKQAASVDRVQLPQKRFPYDGHQDAGDERLR